MCVLKSPVTYSGIRLRKQASPQAAVFSSSFGAAEVQQVLSRLRLKSGLALMQTSWENDDLSGLRSQRSTGHNVTLRQEPFTVYGENLTKPPLNCRTELLEELQPSKKVKDSFAVDFRVRIVSVPLLGCKLDHFRGCKCVQSPKSHTRVNAAECSVSVRVTKIISGFFTFLLFVMKN